MKGYPVILIFDRWVPDVNMWMRCKCRFASFADMHQYINKHNLHQSIIRIFHM